MAGGEAEVAELHGAEEEVPWISLSQLRLLVLSPWEGLGLMVGLCDQVVEQLVMEALGSLAVVFYSRFAL